MKATTDETHTDNKQQETTKGETIKGILFILWFLASIGFMWYFSETGKPVLILALAGQYFLVFGLIGIFSSRKELVNHCWILMFPYTGIGLFVSGISLWLDKSNTQIPMLFFINLFTLFGLCLLVMFAQKLYKAGKCTETVTGIVTDKRVHIHYSDNATGARKRRSTFCPVYRITFKEQEYLLCNNEYTNIMVPGIGDRKTLKIDPSNPGANYFLEPRRYWFYGIYVLFILTALGAGITLNIFLY